jgi:hypothetical protein
MIMTKTEPVPEPAWERQDGLRKVPITLQDVAEAITASRSLIVKEVEFNPVIKGDPRIRAEYDKHLAVLERLLEKLAYGSKFIRQNPKRLIPSARSRR